MKPLILVKFFFFSIFLSGQNCYNKCLKRNLIDSTKVEIYKSILLSKEIEKKKEFYLVNIQTLNHDVNLNKIIFNDVVFFYDRIKEQSDTVSVKKLTKELPYYYKIYGELEEYKYIEYDKRRKMLHTLFSEYYNWKITDYTYVRIYKPLTNWMNLYFYLSDVPEGEPYEIIPVLYTRMKNNKEIERKYMLYEVIFSKEGKIESIKVVN